MEERAVTMEKIVALCKNRGFIFPGSDIYGGLANTWDYGPLGVEFKNNVKKAWWKKFVQESKYNVGLDAAILMNPQTWVASGHVGGFSDPLIDCKECKARFRADKLIEDYMHENGIEGITVDGWSNEKLEEYICASIPDNHTFDLGCLLLNVASVLSGKPIAELSVADIDIASSMPGMDFFKVEDGVLEVEPISEWHLDDLAAACGLKKQECPWNISSSAIATHRNCYFDKIDWMRIERLPEYVLNELQYQLAISFHAIFKKMSNPHLPILPEQAAEDFDSQPEELRRQGFEQALSVQRQLERLKYELVPLGSGRDHMVIPQFPEREIIALARNEHGRWLKLHERQGYTFHELVDGKRLEEDESGKPVKYNEYMLPWKELVRVDLEGNPIQVEENSIRELKKTRARNDIEWAEYLVRVIGEVAKLGIVKKQTK